jgi:hypothetical protein
VLLLAHVNRSTAAGVGSGKESYADSAAWHNNARSRLFLKRTVENDHTRLTLEHQKSNRGALQEPLEFAFHAQEGRLSIDAPVDLSGVLGEPVAQIQPIDAVLALIDEFYRMGKFISPHRTARNNAFKELRPQRGFPKSIKSLDQLMPLLIDTQRQGRLEVEHYRHDRKYRERWKLPGTPFAPSSPAAPSSDGCALADEGASTAQGGAPTAPTWAGGMGERAHTPGADESAHPAGLERTAANTEDTP